jgi:Subtilase family
VTEFPRFADERFRRQFELIERSYRERGIPLAVHEERGQAVAIYASDRMLVRAEFEDAVRQLFGGDALPRADVENIPGLVVLLVQGRSVPEVLAEIAERLQPGIASYCHVLSVTPVACCPGSEPERPGCWDDDVPPCPPPRDCDGDHPVRVGVSDTGLLDDAATHPWLQGVTGEQDPLGADDPVTALPTIPPYAGHGTFIAGVARCIAPGARVHVDDHLPTNFAAADFDYAIVAKLVTLLGRGVQLINLSAGGTTVDGGPMLSFEVFYEQYLSQSPGVVLVAAAGNNADDVPFWPAAADWAVGVGALGPDCEHRAWFSNFGNWVDVWVRGEAMVNAFASGLYTYDWPPQAGAQQVFAGMARWSGTSFATPVVVGLIAERMSRTGEDATTALAAVLAVAQAQALPGLGPALDLQQVI